MDSKEKPEKFSEISLHKLRILEALEEEPEIRQIDLAVRLGVAIGTVNWHLKRLAAKGYVKIKKIGKWRWSYLLTPQGLAEKARLTKVYVQHSMQLYRKTREKARRLLQEVKQAGYRQVRIKGDPQNDLVDVYRLTCLEQGIKVIDSAADNDELPTLHIDGWEQSLEWPRKQRLHKNNSDSR